MSVAHADTHWGFDDVSVDRLYTVEQAAALLGIGRTKVYELVSSGRLPSVTIGRSRRIRRSALRVYISSLEQVSS